MQPLPPFSHRHIGPDERDIRDMLRVVGAASLDEFTESVVPASVRSAGQIRLPEPLSELEALTELRRMGSKNHIYRSLIGKGYNDTIVPGVIQRNILENPGWYTQYTLSGGNRTGTAGSPSQFSDNGYRPHRPGNRERLAP
jgi:glycine dehydrogenase